MSIHRDPRGRSPYWFAAFTGADGKRHFKSTKCTHQRDAETVARKMEEAARLARYGRLTPDRAREIVTDAVVEVASLAPNAEALNRKTVTQWAGEWLQRKKLEAEAATSTRYEMILSRFNKWLGGRAQKDIETIRPGDIAAFRDYCANNLSRSTANLSVKVLRAFFNGAVKDGLLPSNPAQHTDTLKQRGEGKRRAFTLDEIRRVLEACGDSEWRGLVLFGIYSGQRLGDLARLTWRAIDMQKKTLSLITRKTGRRQQIPLAKPLVDYLAELPGADNPDACLFPQSAAMIKKQVAPLSRSFREDILVAAGLVEKRDHQAKPGGKGRDGSRDVAEVSFHSLRHSATTMLKAAGASDVIAREIIGHDSEIVSRRYTHLEAEHLREAIDKLPDVTKPAEKGAK